MYTKEQKTRKYIRRFCFPVKEYVFDKKKLYHTRGVMRRVQRVLEKKPITNQTK